MPLYEYKCQTCGFRHEQIERASEPKDGVCPECGGVTTRLIGTPALQFKGSGWYVNDYGKGNDNGSAPTERETSQATAAASTADSKSDTTGAAKPTTDASKKPAATTP
jgi:putative FmdB family regulatory protein